MSSMRNAVQRRNHKERAQPLERQKWGLLEKHKDYALRSRDHNAKKQRLRALRQKATERNPDEFAFGMMSSTTKNGVKIAARGAENGTSGSLSVDLVKLLKTQDAGYLQTVLQQTRKEKARLREQVILLDHGVTATLPVTDLGRRKRFDEDGNEIADLLALRESDDEDDMDDVEEPETLDKEQRNAKRKQARTVEVLKNRLEAVEERQQKLTQALNSLEDQKAQMNGTVGGVNKNGVKFKVRERKR